QYLGTVPNLLRSRASRSSRALLLHFLWYHDQIANLIVFHRGSRRVDSCEFTGRPGHEVPYLSMKSAPMFLQETYPSPKAGEMCTLQFIADGFNVTNRTNYASVNNIVAAPFAPPFNVRGTAAVSPSQPLGFTAAFPRREIQLGVRLSF